MKIESHKDLRVWQEAMDAAMEIFRLTQSFPEREKFSLTDQVRRASRSVASNISEAWRKRRYAAAFVSKLNDSEGEAAESQTAVELARRCGYLSDAQAAELDARYEKILGQLVNMINHPEQWVLPAREDRARRRQGERGRTAAARDEGGSGRQGDEGNTAALRSAVPPSPAPPVAHSSQHPQSPRPKSSRA